MSNDTRQTDNFGRNTAGRCYARDVQISREDVAKHRARGNLYVMIMTRAQHSRERRARTGGPREKLGEPVKRAHCVQVGSYYVCTCMYTPCG